MREELKDVKRVWRAEVWVESDDREETAEAREEVEERRE